MHRSCVQGIECRLWGVDLRLQVPLTPGSGCDLAGKIFIAGIKVLSFGSCLCMLSTWNCAFGDGDVKCLQSGHGYGCCRNHSIEFQDIEMLQFSSC